MSESKDIASVEEVVGELKCIAARSLCHGQTLYQAIMLLQSQSAKLSALEKDAGYKVALAGALLTIEQIRQIACGEIEPMDDDLADAQLKRIYRMCVAHLNIDTAIDLARGAS